MSAQERDWKPGDKAYIEVEVRGIERAYAEVRIVGPGTDEGLAYPSLDALRPVPDGDAIERVRQLFALYGVGPGQSSDLVKEFTSRGLLVGGASPVREPGRSETLPLTDTQPGGVAQNAPISDTGRSEGEWGVRAVWDDGEVAEGPLSESPNTEEAAREVCAALIDEWGPQVRSAEVVSRVVGPWLPADQVADTEGSKP